MTKVFQLKRRQFLLGAGGFTLALPVLPSLLSDKARAQVRIEKRFVGIGSTHGGVWAQNMFPSDADADQTHELFPGHTAHHGTLRRQIDGSDAFVSPVLKAPDSELTEAMVSKMNVIRGCGVMFYIAHHSGGHLGNYARRAGNGGDLPIPQRPTIDQILAWSPTFYDDLGTVAQRSIHVDSSNSGSALSFGWSDPVSGSGSMEAMPVEESSLALFDRMFVPADDPAMPRRPVVDRVLDHYNGLSSGRFGDAARLASADRQRLNDYMERLYELQRRLEARGAASCGDVTPPTDDAERSSRDPRIGGSTTDLAGNIEWYGLWNDVIATAFMCGTSRVATIYPRKQMVDGYANRDWHDVAHNTSAQAGQDLMVQHQNNVFRHVFLDLANKLDVEELDGQTFLDNSLIQWTQESGFVTHFSLEVPIVTAGGAAGYFQTGRLVDYRSRDSRLLPKSYWWNDESYKKDFREGLSYNQWLGTVLQSMGLSRSEYEEPGVPGYGDPYTDKPEAWTDAIRAAAGDPVPLITS